MYHINPNTGNPGACSAEDGNCPYGGGLEDHFTSPAAARAAYEESQAPAPTSLSAKELSTLAREAATREEIATVIASGTPRNLGVLSKNENLIEADAAAILRRPEAHSGRLTLLRRFPGLSEAMTPDDLVGLLAKPVPKDNVTSGFIRSPGKFSSLVNNPSLTDEHYEAVMESPAVSDGVKDHFVRVLGEDNLMSSSLTSDYLVKGGWRPGRMDPVTAFQNGKLTVEDLEEAPRGFLTYYYGTGVPRKLDEASVDKLATLAAKRDIGDFQLRIARDERTSPETLSRYGRTGMAPAAVYENPNTPEAVREVIATKYQDSPGVRMAILKKQIGEENLNAVVANRQVQKLGRSYTAHHLTFDLELIKKHGLTREDVLELAKASNFNDGFEYNESTGRFVGRLDTSD